ncbi:MAG: extracellular catalytic domain type 1 short-chain-length polyhydroxyalkanoate depolymerase [Burkholderiaceae bacterium]
MIFKKLTSLWKRSVKRVVKSQQRQAKKVIKSLIVKPPAKVRRRTPTPLKTRAKASPIKPPIKRPIQPAVVLPPAGKWLTSSLSSSFPDVGVSVNRMKYWLYLPNHPENSRLPLVVMLHGCGQSATQFAQSTRMNFLADKKGFAVLYPQRPVSKDPSRCWHWYKKSVQQGGGEVKAIVGIVEEVVEKYMLDKSRIYIAGISAGAAMANIVALNNPGLIAAVGIHSGSVFGAANSPAEGYSVMQHGTFYLPEKAIQNLTDKFNQYLTMPAILIHGKKDTVVRPVNLNQLTTQFCALNRISSANDEATSVVKTEKPGGPRSGNAYKMSDYYIGKKVMVKVCEIAELDHAWSGGDGTVRFSESKGPDASKLMWDFFAKHKRVLTDSASKSAKPL